MSRDEFDPDNITKDSMNRLADKIEEYIDDLWPAMVIPDDIMDDVGDDIKEGFKRSRKLIEKLRKGDDSVFKDPDDWNSIF